MFTDVASGARSDRPGLVAALDYVRPGNALVVVRLDRLGNLITFTDDLRSRGVAFRSLREGIDTSTPTGRLMLHVWWVRSRRWSVS